MPSLSSSRRNIESGHCGELDTELVLSRISLRSNTTRAIYDVRVPSKSCLAVSEKSSSNHWITTLCVCRDDVVSG